MIRRGSSLTRVSPFFFLSLFNSTSIIDSQTTNDNRFSYQGIALHTRRIFFSSNQRREDITRSPLIGKIAFDRLLACFTVSFSFFSLFRNYYSGHLALIRRSTCFSSPLFLSVFGDGI